MPWRITSASGEQLYLNQPAIILQTKTLETKWVASSSNAATGVTLTEAGKYLLHYAVQHARLAEVGNALAHLKESNNGVESIHHLQTRHSFSQALRQKTSECTGYYFGPYRGRNPWNKQDLPISGSDELDSWRRSFNHTPAVNKLLCRSGWGLMQFRGAFDELEPPSKLVVQ